MGKNFLTSKTIWVNAIVILAMLIQTQTGFVIDAEDQIAILGVVNILLRLITKEPVAWGKGIRMLGVLLIIFLISGCASSSKSGLATKSLLAMKETVVGIAEAADELCTMGQLSQKECDAVRDIYEKSQVSYDAAADMLVVALKTGDAKDNWEKYKIFHDKFLQLYQGIYNIGVEFKLIPVIEGAVPNSSVDIPPAFLRKQDGGTMGGEE